MCEVEMKYPEVVHEFDTVTELLNGSSIARLGDGEFKMIVGQGYIREPANERMAKELQRAVKNPHPSCIAGIPRLDDDGPKNLNWLQRIDRIKPHLREGMTYYSAFISRPDSAPWINNVKFAKRLQKLWLERHVAVVCEPTSSMLRMLAFGAGKITHIPCPRTQAYSLIDLFERAVIDAKPQIAFLGCGPTATCLANRLAKRGIQTIDFGSGGAFMAKLLAQ
jgi:hypothetical protein